MKKRTILVVEDDGYIADVLKSLLEANDYLSLIHIFYIACRC